jgi:hypothetical protein
MKQALSDLADFNVATKIMSDLEGGTNRRTAAELIRMGWSKSSQSN